MMNPCLNAKEIQAIELMFPSNEQYHGNVHFAVNNANGFKSIGYIDVNNIVDRIIDMKLYPNADYYLTSNTTRTGERITDNIFSYNNIVVDIDCHNDISLYELNDALEECLYRIQRDLYETGTIPPHNILVKTGRGMQLWWCIQQIPSELGWLYHHAQKSLILAIKDMLEEYSELEYLSVDEGASSNKIGFYRMPATINTKTGTQVQTIVNTDNRYDVNELTSYFYENKKEEKAARTPMFDKTFRSLHHQRIDCIRKLAIEKKEEGIKEGYRDSYAWLYYNACYQVYSLKKADEMLDELNSIFPIPLKGNELKAIKRYIQHKGGLRMKQSTFFELLGEEPAIKTRAMIRDEKRREKERRNQKIKQLYHEGKTVKEICAIIQISKPTVLKVLHIKLMKQKRNEQIIAMKKAGASFKAIAKKFNLSLKSIQRIIKNKIEETHATMSEKQEQVIIYLEHWKQAAVEEEEKDSIEINHRILEKVGWT